MHKKASKFEADKFDTNYKQQIEKWAKSRKQRESEKQESEQFEPVKMNKTSARIVNGGFRNLGNMHSHSKVAQEVSLESKLDALRSKYQSGKKLQLPL